MILSDLPEGQSWRVSSDGEARHYKTRKGAEKRCAELTAQGKVAVISTYYKEPTLNILGGTET